jgi:hypothetical protein
MTTPERKSRSACGPRTELASNDGARITRCPCGTIHLHLAQAGVTLQLTEQTLAELAAATRDAMRDIDASEDERAARAGERGTSSSIN